MSVSVNVTSADEQAIAAVVDHHAALLRGLQAWVLTLERAVSEGGPYERALGALTAYLATNVLPHAAAEEAVLYPALAADAGGGLFVDAMLLDHEELTERTRALANVCDPYVALALVEGALAVFALHVRKENELLLPALQRADGVSVAGLLRSMQERLGAADAARDVPEPGPIGPAGSALTPDRS
jgi:iron-sulfur cluster repair protein YtfE (RIC family)